MDHPKVGVGVLIFNQFREVLLIERIGSHGEFTWAPIGGHLEYKEGFENCAMREAQEAMDIAIQHMEVLGITNDIFLKEKEHYVSIFLAARLKEGSIPVIREKDKIKRSEWFRWENLPKKLFLPLENFLKVEKNVLNLQTYLESIDNSGST